MSRPGNDFCSLLELVLPSGSQLEYERALAKFGELREKGARYGLAEGERLLRRLSIGRTIYREAENRTVRTGLDWTYGEGRILDYAIFKHDPERKEKPSMVYLSLLLQRTIGEVEEKLKEMEEGQKVKMGIKGFF